jgi:hypothetical protein
VTSSLSSKSAVGYRTIGLVGLGFMAAIMSGLN